MKASSSIVGLYCMSLSITNFYSVSVDYFHVLLVSITFNFKRLNFNSKRQQQKTTINNGLNRNFT